MSFKSIKGIVLGTKGGVGKSTAAVQLIAPYFYERSGKKVEYIEIDAVNNDSEAFSNSEIINTHKVSPADEESIIKHLSNSNSHVVFDIGGNTTTLKIVETIGYNEEFHNLWWFIPLGDGEQEKINAFQTYSEVLSVDEDAKVVFILSKTSSNQSGDNSDSQYGNSIEEEFMEVFGHKYFDIPDALEDNVEDFTYVVMPNSTALKISRKLKSTLYEINTKEYRERTRQALNDADSERDEYKKDKEEKDYINSKEYKKLEEIAERRRYFNFHANRCRRFMDKMLRPSMKELDKIIK